MSKKIVTIKQAIESFLLTCKVEGRSYGTIESYKDKLKGFLWHAITMTGLIIQIGIDY